MSLRLLSGLVDDGIYFKRQGFWLRMARERAGKSQKGAAMHIGLADSSKSTISDYERGEQVTPQPVLRTLARWYAVPVELFLHPPISADELIQAFLDEPSRLAGDAERRDWGEGRDQGREADDERGGAPGRLSA